MKIVSLQFLFLCALVISVGGCGAGTEATSTIEGADQSAIEAYEAALAEEESAMDDAAPAEDADLEK